MEEMVNLTAFAKMLGVSRQMLFTLRHGDRPGPSFPEPVYIGGKETLWLKSDAEKYVEARKAYLAASPKRDNGGNRKRTPRSEE